MIADMAGKTVLITGGTNGIGLETARGLAALGAHIFVHGRSAERGKAAIDRIKKKVPGARVDFVRAELSSLAAVKGLAEEVLNRAAKLDVLVNNAGALNFERTLTSDGFETTFGVNHLAPFYLSNLLLDRIKASAPARVVTVSSEVHRIGRIHFDDLNLENGFSGFGAYAQSKLANILFTRALTERLAGTGVTANSVHPGAVRSGFGRNNKGLGLIATAAGLFMASPAQGAKTSIHVASAPAVEGVSGKYFAKCKEKTPSKAARDDAVAERLWRVSAQLVGLA